MTKLTEDMVIARTKTSDLSTVKKFNCWGSDLNDISICRRLLNVEVLSLSVNKIDTLQHFQNCRNLTELYVRRNEIKDLTEIVYLQDLPKLRRLLLAENPAVETAGHLYRATVLRCLPELEVLDNQAVTAEEVESAMKSGLILEHPEVAAKREPRVPSPEPVVYYERESPPPAPQQVPQQQLVQQRRSQYEFDDEYRQPSNRGPSSSPEYSSQYQQSNGNKTPEAPAALNANTVSVTNTGNSSASVSPGQARASPNSLPTTEEFGSSKSPSVTSSPGSGSARRQSGSPVYEYYPNSAREVNSPRRVSTDYSGDYRNYETYFEDQQSHNRAAVAVPIIPVQRQPPPAVQQLRTKPRTKVSTSNLLSAVLCLIPELDWGSLEVIELAVRRRMEEMIHNSG